MYTNLYLLCLFYKVFSVNLLFVVFVLSPSFLCGSSVPRFIVCSFKISKKQTKNLLVFLLLFHLPWPNIMFLFVHRSVKPVSLLFHFSMFREQSDTVHPAVRCLLSAGVRLQHWALLCPTVWGCQERLFREAVSGSSIHKHF